MPKSPGVPAEGCALHHAKNSAMHWFCHIQAGKRGPPLGQGDARRPWAYSLTPSMNGQSASKTTAVKPRSSTSRFVTSARIW